MTNKVTIPNTGNDSFKESHSQAYPQDSEFSWRKGYKNVKSYGKKRSIFKKKKHGFIRLHAWDVESDE